MKIILFAIIIVLNFSNAMSQTIFKVVEARRNCIAGSISSDNPNSKYYKIILVNDSLNNSLSYPMLTEKHHIDTLEAIKELLSLKGDKRICVYPVMSYNSLRSQIYVGPNKNYSIQVEALFIINQLILEHPFFYSSYPILVNKADGSEASISEYIIDKAFDAYNNWYKMLKKMGISEIKDRKIMPLDGTSIKWY